MEVARIRYQLSYDLLSYLCPGGKALTVPNLEVYAHPDIEAGYQVGFLKGFLQYLLVVL